SLAAIVSTFAEVDAYTVVDRNWPLPYVFVPDQTITIGTATTLTQANDSLETVYDRLHGQDSSITPQLFADQIAPSTNLLRAGTLFAVVRPSTGQSPTTLQNLADAFGADPASIAQANASLVGFVAAGVPIALGDRSLTTGTNDTFTNLVVRFAQSF